MGEAATKAKQDGNEQFPEAMLEELSVEGEPDLIDVDELLGENMKVEVPEEEVLPSEPEAVQEEISDDIPAEVHEQPQETVELDATSEEAAVDEIIEPTSDEMPENDTLNISEELSEEITEVSPEELNEELTLPTIDEPEEPMIEENHADEAQVEPDHFEEPRPIQFENGQKSALLDVIDAEIVKRCDSEEGREYIKNLGLTDLIELRKMVLMSATE